MRAQIVLLRGPRILLAKHIARDRSYWVLPGGSVEPGEQPEEAAVREAREETGLEVRIGRLLFVEQPRCADGFTIKSPRFTYLGEVVDGALQPSQDVEGGHPEKGFLGGVAWMPFDSPEYDAATRDTLCLVSDAIRAESNLGQDDS
jgi:8-oxo-dGTP pyrophosphatase MutT (NUDIX family)